MRNEIARHVGISLARQGLLPEGPRLRARLEGALAAGAAQRSAGLAGPGGWSAERVERAAASVGVGRADLERVLGLGHQQAAALAELLGVEAARVARLGALFNLGISLFDLLHDRFPERAARLADLDAAALAGPAAGQAAFAPRGDAAVDLVLALVTAIVGGAAVLGGAGEARRRLGALLVRMLSAERAVAQARRDRGRATLAVWRHLRDKSTLPLWTVATLAELLRGAAPDLGAGHAARRALVGSAAEALWIVDDLVDAREDWLAGGWSRPWWLLARRGEAEAQSAPLALAGLWSSGLIDEEAARLCARLRRLQRAAPPATALAQVIGVTVASWLAAGASSAAG